MTETYERIGQLYRVDYIPHVKAVRLARLMFGSNPHLNGFQPTEIRVHPAEAGNLPEQVDGLPVVADATVRQQHVFVCCPEVV